MVITLACNAIFNASLAEIEVAIIASTAVIVLIWDSTFAVVAVNREDIDGRRNREAGIIADGILTFVVDTSKFSKPSITGSGTTGNGDLGTVHLGSL